VNPRTALIVIANYNSSVETDACLSAICGGAESGLVLKIVVIDNSDVEPPYHHPDVRVIRPGTNIGLGAAWARGYLLADSIAADYCVFLNNDAVLDKQFFVEMMAGVETYGERTALGPRIVRADGSGAVWSRGGEISIWRASVFHHGGGLDDASLPRKDFETGHLSGCCIFVPMKLLREIGGPDDRYFFHGEEWDLSHRLRHAGARLVIRDSAIVHHGVSKSHDRLSPRILYFAYRAKVLFAKKHQPPLWFPIWYSIGLSYAALFAPLKFALWSRAARSWKTIRSLQGALVRAFVDGLAKRRIEEADYRG
jgi:GT2 family glycosyltransferase